MGYDLSASGYLIFVHHTMSVRRSGHVRFNEHELFFTDALKEEEDKRSVVKTKSIPSAVPPVKKGKIVVAPAAAPSAPTVLAATTATIAPDQIIDVLMVPAPAPTVAATLEPIAVDPITPPMVPITILPPVTNHPAAVHIAHRWSAATAPSRSRRQGVKVPARFRTDGLAYFTADELVMTDDELVNAVLGDTTLDEMLADLSDVPSSYANIAGRTDKVEWHDVVEAENESIRRHGALVPIEQVPFLKNIIKAKYVFKRKADGRYKARLVAKGFTQRYGEDYKDVFAPVVSKNSLRALLALAATENWNIHQLDVETAFLHGELEEDLYMEAPKGFGAAPGAVFKLAKSLYGLKQAPRQWNLALHHFLVSQGFKRNTIDSGVYSLGSGSSGTHLAVYVDDILMFGHDLPLILNFKRALNAKFAIKDLGEVKNILGMLVTRDRVAGTITLSQTDYLRQLALKYRLDPDRPAAAKSVPISKGFVQKVPLSKGTALSIVPNANGSAAPLNADVPYRSLLGAILYANTCSRPDISFAVSSLGSHCSAPKQMHWNALVELLKYINDTQDIAITYGGPPIDGSSRNQVSVFADANFSKHIDIAKSRSGYVLFMNGGAIAWKSCLQRRIAMSTTESELYAMYDAVEQALWFREFLGVLGFPQETTVCNEDNSGLIDWITNNSSASRMKSIPAEYYRLREDAAEKRCVFVHVTTDKQRADLFTKAMDHSLFDVQYRMLFNLPPNS